MKNFENVNDEQMVEFVIRFDKNLYRDLIRRREKELTDYVEYLIGDKRVVNEVIQKTFVEAYKNLRSFNVKNNFLIWLYTILQKEVQKRADKSEVIKLSKAKAGLEMESEKELKRIAGKIKGYLLRLAVQTRSVAILHYLMNKSDWEIAEILGISEKRVRDSVNLIRANLERICSK